MREILATIAMMVSLMPVSQRGEADSLDSTVYGTGGGNLGLAPPEQESDCWGVFSMYEEESAGSVSGLALREHQINCCSASSEYDEEIVSNNTFWRAIKVKVGCWSAPEEQQSPGMAVGVYVGKEGTLVDLMFLRARLASHRTAVLIR